MSDNGSLKEIIVPGWTASRIAIRKNGVRNLVLDEESASVVKGGQIVH
jgi:hypothetical protein